MIMPTKWAIETCCRCSMQFLVATDVRERWRESGESFYCPNGHPQRYSKSRLAVEREARLAVLQELKKKETRIEELQRRIAELKGDSAAAAPPIVKRRRGRPRKTEATN